MKRVLFIPIGFYDYDNIMENAIRQQGYEVKRFTPVGKYTTVQKLVNFATKGKYLDKKTRSREKKYLLDDKTKYDYVFVINGRQLHPDNLKQLKQQQDKAKFILYLWDDVARVEHFEENKEFFDVIYSFDNNDVAAYGFKPLTNFYTEVHRYKGEKKNILMSMTGLLHSGRLVIWDKIVRDLKIKPERCYLRMLGFKISDFVKAVLPGKDRWMNLKYIKVNPVPLADMAEVMKRSRVTLDVQFGSQAGLTFRTFDSMIARTKLITTNETVKSCDLYEYGNIYVIDRDNPVVPKSFFTEPFHEIPEEVMEQYSVQNWVKKVFEG